jgi:hypothetical protein
MPQTKSDLENIVEKIEKLLSLSTSPNEAEAIAAFAKAQELMLRHNLSMKDVEKVKSQQDEQKVDYEPIYSAKKVLVWRTILAYGVSVSNHCVSLTARYDGEAYIVLVGRKINTTTAKIQFEYLATTVERISKEVKPSNRVSPGRYRNSFRMGMAYRLQERMVEISEKQKQEGILATEDSVGASALVVCSLYDTLKQEANDFVNKKVNLKESKKTKFNISAEGYYAGMEVGESISLSKQIAPE